MFVREFAMSRNETGISWLRRATAWSNSVASWRERLVLLAFLLAGAGLIYFSTQASLWQTAIAWAVYVVALAIGTRQGWLQLFGPVLFYDMVRTARQNRYVLMRLFYASVLLSILFIMYLSTATERRVDQRAVFFSVLGLLAVLLGITALFALLTVLTSRTAHVVLLGLIGVLVALFIVGVWLWNVNLQAGQREDALLAALFAQFFFLVFLMVQLALVVLLTPAYVAGAIADEKDRKTLEFMLATDLSNHEIVLSKLLSRLANMVLFLLTGLPILSILQLVGGVDAELMLYGFAGTGLTMLGIASVGILFSTLLKRPRDAIGMTYLFIIAYGALATLLEAQVRGNPVLMAETIWYGDVGPSWAEVSNVLNAGNPIAAIVRIREAIARATLATDLPAILTDYAYFYGVLTLVCVAWSILRIRAVALKQAPGGATQRTRWWSPRRPAIGDVPMLWKELHIEGRLRLHWLGFAVVVVLVLLTLGSGLMLAGSFGWDFLFRVRDPWRDIAREMNLWFRIAGSSVASIILLIVAVRASTSIAGERERDTFDALVTTPLGCEAILASKLVGCLMGVRLGWVWFGSMTALAVITGGLDVLAVSLVFGAWFIYGVFFTMVGLWFSMVCRSALRATVMTVVASLFFGGGHWLLLGLCCYAPAFALMRGGGQDDLVPYLMQFELGMTPPFVIGLLANSRANLAHDFRPGTFEMGQMFFFALIGLFLWAAVCVFFWYGLLLPKFREITRREDTLSV